MTRRSLARHLEAFGFEACAVVVGPDGVRDRCGDTHRQRPLRSVTKPLTGIACLLAVQAGHVTLEDAAGPEGSTLRHLLAHASGLFYESDRVLQAPGTRRGYSNRGIDVAAQHVERAVGVPFGDWVRRVLLEPLGMHGVRWTGSAAVGAFGSAEDLALLCGELLRPRLLDAALHAEATTAQFPDLEGIMPGFGKQTPNPFGLGLEIRGEKTPHWTGSQNSPRTVGHFGMAGSAFWVDPDADLALALGTDHEFCGTHRRCTPALSDAVLEIHRERIDP